MAQWNTIYGYQIAMEVQQKRRTDCRDGIYLLQRPHYTHVTANLYTRP